MLCIMQINISLSVIMDFATLTGAAIVALATIKLLHLNRMVGRDIEKTHTE